MLRYMTAGESHGKGLVAIIDGLPSGLKLEEAFINNELARRMSGYGRGERMQIEKDKAEIISGARGGVTIGSPVCLMISNRDYKIEDLPEVTCPRPGHADLAGILKHGFGGARSVLERASARETAARVAAGAVSRLFLMAFGIKVLSHVTMIGAVKADTAGLSSGDLEKAELSELRCADRKAEALMKKEIDSAREAGDTLGGEVEVLAEGVPPGLGSYSQWDRRLDGLIARALMSIPAVKAVSIGNGIEAAAKRGREVHDPIMYDGSKKAFTRGANNSGGLEGGLTNGSTLLVRVFMKPIATLADPLPSVDMKTKKAAGAAVERSDVTAVPACGVVAESAVAFELASAFLEKFGGDSLAETKRNYEGYLDSVRKI